MKNNYKYYGIFSIIFLAMNVLSIIIVFLLWDFNSTINTIISFSSLIFIPLFSIVMVFYILKMNLSVKTSAIIVYIIIVLYRSFEVFVFKDSLLLLWGSLNSICSLLGIILKDGTDYLYWWSVPVFSTIQPLCIVLFYSIWKKQGRLS